MEGDGGILYIGKAKDLKRRVSSYFRKRDLDAKTRMLVEAADSLDFIVTGNEVEALILENSLIKQHQPRFNIDLKDAKAYAYIQLTDEPFPAIRIARNPAGSGTFFGPFVSAAERDYVRDLVETGPFTCGHAKNSGRGAVCATTFTPAVLRAGRRSAGRHTLNWSGMLYSYFAGRRES